MESGWVVEGVYVIEGEELELIRGGDGFVGDGFGFEGGPKGLHESVIVAVAPTTHVRALGVRVQKLTVSLSPLPPVRSPTVSRGPAEKANASQ